MNGMTGQMCGTHVCGKNDYSWYKLRDESSCQATRISKQPGYDEHDAEALT